MPAKATNGDALPSSGLEGGNVRLVSAFFPSVLGQWGILVSVEPVFWSNSRKLREQTPEVLRLLGPASLKAGVVRRGHATQRTAAWPQSHFQRHRLTQSSAPLRYPNAPLERPGSALL